MERIKQYILALTNLYGQVTPELVTEIYNSQNELQIEISDVKAYLQEDLRRYYIYDYKNHFVHETTMEFDDFNRITKEQKGKPYYIPEKEELLKYSDMSYYEEPKQYHNLVEYIKTNIMPENPEKVERLSDDFLLSCRFEFRTDDAISFIQSINADFSNKVQLKEVSDLIIELVNNVRIWENNGHSAQEIQNMLDMKEPGKTVALHNTKRQRDGSLTGIGQRTGRNDPCPCGSGKKYKNCCLDKD